MLLSQLEQKLEASHVVVFLHLEKNQESLVLDEPIRRVIKLVLKLVCRLFNDFGGVSPLLIKIYV